MDIVHSNNWFSLELSLSLWHWSYVISSQLCAVQSAELPVAVRHHEGRTWSTAASEI